MRRQAQHTKPAPRPWDAPGFTFLPRDANGVCLFPRGYEPVAFATARSVARVEADMRQHEHVAEQRRRAIGWAGNTFDMANTPHNQAAPAMMAARLDGDLPAARKAARPAPRPSLPPGHWRVTENTHVWRALCLLRTARTGVVTNAQMAEALDRPAHNLPALLAAWLARGVLVRVELPLGLVRNLRAMGWALGPKAHAVSFSKD